MCPLPLTSFWQVSKPYSNQEWGAYYANHITTAPYTQCFQMVVMVAVQSKQQLKIRLF